MLRLTKPNLYSEILYEVLIDLVYVIYSVHCFRCLHQVSIEVKKMIVNSVIKSVDVYRDYDLNIELNMNIRQFFLGMEESESDRKTA